MELEDPSNVKKLLFYMHLHRIIEPHSLEDNIDAQIALLASIENGYVRESLEPVPLI